MITNATAQKQAPLGIASFIIGLICFLTVVYLTANFIRSLTAGGSNEAGLLGIMFAIPVFVLCGIGLGLGITAYKQKQYRRGMSMAGMIFNGGIIGLMLMGVMVFFLYV